MPEGFALDEYHTPRGEINYHIPGGTMAKSTAEHSSTFAHARKIGSSVPGPGQYDVMALGQKEWASKGNSFVKLARDARMKPKPSPAVGQYQLAGAMVLTSPRIKGGTMAKSPKGCALTDNAVRRTKNLPEPGKYDTSHLREHTTTMAFGAAKTQSRAAAAKVPPGPGTYEINLELTEPRIPAYSSSKKESKSVIDDIQKEKAKIPSPGYVGIPDSKFMDRQGTLKHAQHLLRDR